MSKIYCIHCGSENTSKSIKCRVCSRYLRVVDKKVQSFLLDEAKDEIRSDIVDVVKDFIKSHLYGVILTISLVAVGVPSAIIASKNLGVNYVTKPSIVIRDDEEMAYETLNSMLMDYSKNGTTNEYNYSSKYNDIKADDSFLKGINSNSLFITTTRYLTDDNLGEEMSDAGISKSATMEFYVVNLTEEYGEVSIPISIVMVKRDNKWYYLKDSDGLYDNYSTNYKDMIYKGKIYSPAKYSEIISKIKENK